MVAWILFYVSGKVLDISVYTLPGEDGESGVGHIKGRKSEIEEK